MVSIPAHLPTRVSTPSAPMMIRARMSTSSSLIKALTPQIVARFQGYLGQGPRVGFAGVGPQRPVVEHVHDVGAVGGQLVGQRVKRSVLLRGPHARQLGVAELALQQLAHAATFKLEDGGVAGPGQPAGDRSQ